MTIRDYLDMYNDLSGVRIRVFDCSSENIIYDSRKDSIEDPVLELMYGKYADEEIGSVDLYRTNGEMFLELNIDLGEDYAEEDEDDDDSP